MSTLRRRIMASKKEISHWQLLASGDTNWVTSTGASVPVRLTNGQTLTWKSKDQLRYVFDYEVSSTNAVNANDARLRTNGGETFSFSSILYSVGSGHIDSTRAMNYGYVDQDLFKRLETVSGVSVTVKFTNVKVYKYV